MTAGLEYQEIHDFYWTKKAYGMLERGDLHGEAVSQGGVVRCRVWGKCPRCDDDSLDDRQEFPAVASGRRGSLTQGPPQTWQSVEVVCSCSETHPGARHGKTGCGVGFKVELAIQVLGAR